MAKAYLGEALYADDYLGKLLDALKRLKLDERTVVVVIGDHGEVFDHAHDHVVEAQNQPTLHHHGWSAYDETIRVPLVVSGGGPATPGGVPDAKITAQVSLIDVLPTLLEILGQQAGRSLRGRSLTACWTNSCEDRPAFVEGQEVRALRHGGWLYLQRSDGRLRIGSKRVRVDEELYHDGPQHQPSNDTARLKEMRQEMARLAPTPPDAPEDVAHLRLAGDSRPHLVTGVLRSDGEIKLRSLANAEAVPIDTHSVKIALRGPGQIDVSLEPRDAPLSLQLMRDGAPLSAKQILVGGFALPLLDEAALHEGEWSWADAARPPIDGERGDLLLWRDPSQSAEVAAVGVHANDEVAGMMQRWGYAQPTPGNAREKR
jgi:hypothetical protein